MYVQKLQVHLMVAGDTTQVTDKGGVRGSTRWSRTNIFLVDFLPIYLEDLSPKGVVGQSIPGSINDVEVFYDLF